MIKLKENEAEQENSRKCFVNERIQGKAVSRMWKQRSDKPREEHSRYWENCALEQRQCGSEAGKCA